MAISVSAGNSKPQHTCLKRGWTHLWLRRKTHTNIIYYHTSATRLEMLHLKKRVTKKTKKKDFSVTRVNTRIKRKYETTLVGLTLANQWARAFKCVCVWNILSTNKVRQVWFWEISINILDPFFFSRCENLSKLDPNLAAVNQSYRFNAVKLGRLLLLADGRFHCTFCRLTTWSCWVNPSRPNMLH